MDKLMTVSELERYAKIVRDDGNAEVSDMVLALIDDWRAMRSGLEALRTQSWNQSIPLDFAQTILDGLKVKP